MSCKFMFLFVQLQGQIDGNVVRAKFTLPERKKLSPPPKVVATASKKEAPKADNVGAHVEKDEPKRQREGMVLVVVILVWQSWIYLFVLLISNNMFSIS